MDQGQLAQVLARIENAFVRIDAAVAGPQAESAVAALVEQNIRLREAVADALGELDVLIEQSEP